MFICQECRSYFAETHGTVIARLKTPLSQIINVLKARMEGMGLNAAVRVHGYSNQNFPAASGRGMEDVLLANRRFPLQL